MATKAIKSPIFKAVSRNYAGQAVPVSGIISCIKTKALPNKLVVASSENGAAICRLSVVYRAGSRYETPENQGVTHMLRLAAGLSTKNSTNFAITRNLQQIGASLICTTDREIISYTLEGTYEAVEKGSEFLSDVASLQVFKPWEVADLIPRLKLEISSLSPQVRAINFLHRAAFREGLGNSLFCAKHNVGKISSETLQHYVNKNFTTNRTAVVGLGINHNQLKQYAQNMPLESGDKADAPSNYYGGEIRSEKGGNLAYVAVGTKGGSLCNEKTALSFAVLQRVFGVGPYAKRGMESGGLLSKAVCCPDSTLAVSALNASYSDNGLFGFMLAGSFDEVGSAVEPAIEVLRNPCINDENVDRAKNQLITATLLKAESGTNFIQTMGHQAVLLGDVRTPEQIVEAIEGICITDVKAAASQVAKSKLSMASVGNLSKVPYLDNFN